MGWASRARGFVLAFLILLIPAAGFAAPKFPPLTGRVVDDAQLLSPATEQKLTDELAGLEAKTGRQLVVATLPDLQGYEIEDYGYQLGRAWGIGRAGKDDGAILIVAPKERKVRIEVGYGLEPVLTDALSSTIINSAVLPRFKAGDMEGGIVQGTEAIVQQLSLPDADARAQAQAAQVRIEHPARSSGGFGFPVIVIILIVFWILSGVLRGFGMRRRYGGSRLWWLLPLLLSSSSRRGGGWSGGGWSGGGGGGFSGGGGSFGGGGASGSW
jgi:uncharacterized protein